jgi:hypothetical protein
MVSELVNQTAVSDFKVRVPDDARPTPVSMKDCSYELASM